MDLLCMIRRHRCQQNEMKVEFEGRIVAKDLCGGLQGIISPIERFIAYRLCSATIST